MCFSAEASFTGSAIISAIGITTLTKIKKPAQILFAAIPLIFGVQQCAEGILWITLKTGSHESLEQAATYIFLVTALFIWPTMIPLSVWFMEKASKRRTILAYLVVLGCLTSLLYGYCLIFYDVTPQIQSFHIQYVDKFPGILTKILFVLYLITTIVPIFISSIRRMWLFGVLIAVSCLITGIFFTQYLTSVWCFFAAVISILIYWILRGIGGPTKERPQEIHVR